MTFSDFESYVDWCIDTDGITVQETNPPGESGWVAFENINDMDPALVVDMLLSAYDSGFYLGHWDTTRYNGSITIYE